MKNKKTTTFLPEELKSLSEKELLSFYDNPRNIPVNDCRNEEWENSEADFPEHCLVFLTHGSFAVNEQIRRITDLTKTQFLRLIRNYSDFGTRKMTKKSGIPDDNVLCFPGSRAIGDPNREYKNEEEDLELDQGKKYIRDHDFNEQVIIKKPGQFRDTGKSKTELYHSVISSKLELAELLRGGSIGIDIHDTGVNLMNVDPELDTIKEEGFPDMIIGTKDGESCNPEILDFFVERLNHYLGLKIYTNKLYKGGYVTTRHGKEYREELNDGDGLKKSKRNLIQVELGRYLYMKESTQEVDWERMEIIGEGIKRAITDLGLEFGKEYFEKLNR